MIDSTWEDGICNGSGGGVEEGVCFAVNSFKSVQFRCGDKSYLEYDSDSQHVSGQCTVNGTEY